MNGEREPLDLSEYIAGTRTMWMTCWKCKVNKTDITKDFISAETQNNIRKKSPDYNPACDELVIFSRTCEDCKRKELTTKC